MEKQYKVIEEFELNFFNREILENAVFKLTEKELDIFYNFIDNNDENYLSTLSIFSRHLAFSLGVYGIKKQNIEITIKYIRYVANINFNIYI